MGMSSWMATGNLWRIGPSNQHTHLSFSCLAYLASSDLQVNSSNRPPKIRRRRLTSPTCKEEFLSSSLDLGPQLGSRTSASIHISIKAEIIRTPFPYLTDSIHRALAEQANQASDLFALPSLDCRPPNQRHTHFVPPCQVDAIEKKNL